MGQIQLLREGGWAAASVNTVPERAFATRVDAIVGQHWPERAPIAARYLSLGSAGLLRSLFTAAGFHEVETFTEIRRYSFPSFGAYFKPIEEGQGEPGQAFVRLPTAIQRLVREDVCRQLEGSAITGGPVEVEVELLFGWGPGSMPRRSHRCILCPRTRGESSDPPAFRVRRGRHSHCGCPPRYL